VPTFTPEHQRQAARARWTGTTPEERQAKTTAARRALALAEIKRSVAESRRAQGLPETVNAEQFLRELAAEIVQGGWDR
jgi:predicted RNA-binding Zn ribbon-like protein